METLTRRQKEIYNFIRSYIIENGMAPSYRDIGRGVGLKNVSAVSKHIHYIEDKGWIQTESYTPRSIRIKETDNEKGIGNKDKLGGGKL